MKFTPMAATVGISGPAAGYTMSLTSLEPGLRVASLIVGIMVRVLSCISLAFRIRSKWRAYQFNKRNGLTGKEETSTI